MKKALPIGIENFEEIIENGYYYLLWHRLLPEGLRGGLWREVRVRLNGNRKS